METKAKRPYEHYKLKIDENNYIDIYFHKLLNSNIKVRKREQVTQKGLKLIFSYDIHPLLDL